MAGVLTTDVLTIDAARAPAFIQVDNRALILFDGLRGAMLPSATFPWVAETLSLVLEEQRATRSQHQHVLGGLVLPDGDVRLFGGAPADLVSVVASRQGVGDLLARLTRR